MSTPNVLIENLYEQLASRYSIDSQTMLMGDWIQKNTRLKGVPFNFNRYPFQKKIADDMHTNLACIKCSQIGLTEVQLRKAVGFASRNNSVNIGYSLPDKTLRDVASNTRLKAIIESNRIFTPAGMQMIRSVETKQINNSYIHMMIATETKAFSIPLDVLLIDELDLTNEEVAVLLNSRLQNSDMAMKQAFSTPTFADFGIDKAYNASDQHEYMVRCQCCNTWQTPIFDDEFVKIPGLALGTKVREITEAMLPELDLVNAGVHCNKCGAELDLNNAEHRAWVPKHPERSQHARGYRVSPFSTGRLGVGYVVQQLISYSGNNFQRGWYNSVLGEVYKDDNIQLSEAIIRAAFGEAFSSEIDPTTPLFVGIDVGKRCHVTLGTECPTRGYRVLKFDIVPAENIVTYVTELCENYNVIAGGMDRFPYTPTAMDVFRASGGKIWPINYTQAEEMKRVTEKDEDDAKEALSLDTYMKANRTMLLDSAAQAFRDQKLRLDGYLTFEKDLIKHMRNMVRDQQPEKQAVWKKLNPADHFFHSIGFFIFSVRMAEYLKSLGEPEEQRTVAMLMPIPTPKLGSILTPQSNLYPGIR